MQIAFTRYQKDIPALSNTVPCSACNPVQYQFFMSQDHNSFIKAEYLYLSFENWEYIGEEKSDEEIAEADTEGETTAYDLYILVSNLDDEIRGLERYYSDKKASLMFHLDSVEETHPILVEISNEIEETKKQRNEVEQQRKELALVEDMSFRELMCDSDKNIEEAHIFFESLFQK